MNITQTLLKNLSGGELQKLAEELLTKQYNWKRVSNNGQVEGGFRTRKGIPDIWVESDRELIYISATGDTAKGKLLADIKKSVKKFDEIKVSKKKRCVGFLKYDPDPIEVMKCKHLCKSNKIEFEYYTNHQISALLDSEYQDLRKKYLSIKFDSDMLSLILASSEDSSLKKVSIFIDNIDWLNKDEKINTSMLIQELLLNAVEYGKASRFEVRLYDQAIVVMDDGENFNLLEFNGAATSGYGGGKATLNLYLKAHNDIEIKYKWKKNPEENIYSFRRVIKLEDKIRVNKDCELLLAPGMDMKQKLEIPKRCNEIVIRIEKSLLLMSKCMRIEKFIKNILEDETYLDYSFKIIVPKNRGMLDEKLTELSGTDSRIKVEVHRE